MAGVKGRSGGARAGAGRKKATTVAEQATRRSIVLDVFDEVSWRTIVQAWLAMAAETPSVIYPLLPFILGAAKQEVQVSGTVEHVTISDIRQALGVVDIRDAKAARKVLG